MRAIVIAPDSFKGALGSVEVALAMARGLNAVRPELKLRLCPMADGGEGTLDAVAVACDSERRFCQVTDANGDTKSVPWLILKGEAQPTAVVEVASIIGLPDARVAVTERTTFGVGELIRHLLDVGMRRILIGLGGTSTNDAGIGALSALGARFCDDRGRPVAGTLSGLRALSHADFSSLDKRLANVDLVLMTDITNPLCGSLGATAVFGPQKGIDANAVTQWDDAMSHFANFGDGWFGRAASLDCGSGAAGGLSYGLMLIGGNCTSGAAYIAELVGLPRMLADAELVITGEGNSDRQTLMGKAPAIVANCARSAGIPAILVSGGIDEESVDELKRSFLICHAVSHPSTPLREAMAKTGILLERATPQVIEEYTAIVIQKAIFRVLHMPFVAL